MSKHPPHLEIRHRAPGELNPNPQNPRVHGRAQIKKISRSIEAFGFIVPILINCDGQIIAGHGRWLAAQALKLPTVPTICVDHLSEAQITAYMIADNRLTEISEWDDRLLATTLRDLSAMDLDFEIETIGFEMGEIDLRIKGLEEEKSTDGTDEIPPLQKAVVTRCGDLWELGRHRVLCGSSLEGASYAQLMCDKLAAAVFTDPPYNVKIDGHVSGLGRVRHREFAMASGEMDAEEFVNFLQTFTRLVTVHSSSGSIHYICIDWRHAGDLIRAGQASYSELKNICVWVKHNAGMGSFYRSQHELVLVFKHGSGNHRNNVQLGTFGRNRTNVWNYPGANSFGKGNGDGNVLEFHPTVKPIAMVADAILDCSKRGDIILDPFLGSGTTLLAAERVGRKCFGMEIDPQYVELMIRRWESLTGAQATHAESGQTFSELTQMRGDVL